MKLKNNIRLLITCDSGAGAGKTTASKYLSKEFKLNLLTSGLAETNVFKIHLINSFPYFRFLMMGIGLLLIMRYRPKGILPEKILNR